MIDLELERKLFQDFLDENYDFENHEETYFDKETQCYVNDGGEDTESLNVAWEVHKKCAESKQAEIDSLKAQLAKIESGEFVVVPKIELMTVIGNCSDAMTDETTSSVYDKTGEPSTWYDHHIIAENKILSMIEAAQENSHE